MSVSPGLEAALARLAKVTVETGTDPVKVVQWLMDLVKFREEIWPTLTPQQRYAFRRKVRQAAEDVDNATY